jgi:hypothetical protein
MEAGLTHGTGGAVTGRVKEYAAYFMAGCILLVALPLVVCGNVGEWLMDHKWWFEDWAPPRTGGQGDE